jgi:soluble lytic murein transglycosylase-like protein
MSRAQDQRFTRGLIVALCLLGLIALFAWVGQVAAADPAQPVAKAYSEPAIPQASAMYRIQVQRAASEYFGLDAPAARLAAQIHQESAWRPDARSAYAWGLAQFTPATAKWLPSVCPELGGFDPWNPNQSVRAMACYDAWLHQRVKPLADGQVDACTRWMFALRAYNGGEGWINRERRAAARSGRNPNRWSDVAPVRLRAEWAHRENTRYPLRILHVLEPAYLKAGWPGQAVC